ncbi:MAG TPA: hypothetical protein DEA82_00330 [Flavobacteriaceae bacterium]|nr:hypothetical protein [Flavobacteriaceae bacterium]HBR52698.1 hypothetical protein [Flavobacteriaceae bacterium]
MHNDAKPVVFRNARILRLNPTKSEELLWDSLKKKQLGVKFRRQHPINNFVLDFYCHSHKISIEIDGKYHDSVEQKAKDEKRTITLSQLGIRELRFTNTAVETAIENVLKQIEEAINKTKDKI